MSEIYELLYYNLVSQTSSKIGLKRSSGSAGDTAGHFALNTLLAVYSLLLWTQYIIIVTAIEYEIFLPDLLQIYMDIYGWI